MTTRRRLNVALTSPNDGTAAIQAGGRPGERAGGEITPQRLRDPARSEGRAAPDDFADESAARSEEAMRVCGNERAAARRSVRESQARLQGGLGGGEIRGAIVAGTV